MLSWVSDTKIEFKDIIQLVFWVVAITLVVGKQGAATETNTQTLKALQEIQADQATDIKYLLLEDAEQKGYEKARKELGKDESH